MNNLGLNILFTWCILMMHSSLYAQNIDSVINRKNDVQWQNVIAPSIGIGYGVASLHLHMLTRLDEDIKYAVSNKIKPTAIDDYIPYMPIAAVYTLDLLGYKAKNNVIDRSIILGLSGIIVAPTVHIIKTGVGRQRPNGSVFNSFPSGHTATAFVAATFLWMEYKDTHPILAHSGFVFATATGALRMYNNRHWFSDVVMGAGVGMLSTIMVYQLYPFLKSWVFNRNDNQLNNSILIPQLSNNYVGLKLNYNFK